MLAPLRDNPRQMAVSRTRSVPAPVGGWDAKNALSDMPEDSAIIMDNMFPNLSDVMLRRGHTQYATGIGAGDVEALMEWSGPGSSKFFAAAGGVIYNISSSGAGVSSATGFTNNRWQHTMISTSGGNFLWICNGNDAPQHYSGSAWATPSLTGITDTDVINVMTHQRRLYFTFINSLLFGYLAVESIAGAVSTFDLGPLCSKGGYLVAMGSWTRDGGAGPDDLACFITSEGQVVIYAGNDPDVAANWALVGVFNIGRPIGRRCVFKVGADLIVITEDGYVPLSVVLPIDRVNAPGAALSDNIRNAVTAATRSFGSINGWQCVLYPKASYALFNVPQNATTYYQHVVNTQTGAWCRFTGQNGICWGLYAGNLYFGTTDGRVMIADNGVSDDGSNIVGHVKPAFNYFKDRAHIKQFKAVRILMSTNGALPVQIDWNVDFENVAPSSVPTAPAILGAVWDTSLWDAGTWASSENLVIAWIGIDGIGYAGTPNIRVSSSTLDFNLKAFDVMYEAGGLL